MNLAAALSIACTALVAVALVAVTAVLALFARDRELRRLADELRHRDAADNARLSLRVRSRGLESIAKAVNAEIEGEQRRRIAALRERAAFQQDLASLSHDIRTPLAGAQGYLQLAERAESEDERGRYARAAVERLDAMRVLVDGLFDYAKASDPDLQLDMTPIPLVPLASEALLDFYPQFSQRGWEPRVVSEDEEGAEDLCALADEDALRRVLANLVANALRHGAGAPRITLSPRPAREVEITVSNPVDPASRIDTDRIFDRFYRADAARSGEGSGLGLAIVAQLVRAMGGTVSARMEDGGDAGGKRLAIGFLLRRARP